MISQVVAAIYLYIIHLSGIREIYASILASQQYLNEDLL